MNTSIQNDLNLTRNLVSVCESMRFQILGLLRLMNAAHNLLRDFDNTPMFQYDSKIESDIREVSIAYSFIEGYLVKRLQSAIESVNNNSNVHNLFDLYIKLVQNQSIRTDLLLMKQEAKTLLLLDSCRENSRYNGVLNIIDYLCQSCLEHIDIKSMFDLTTYNGIGITLWELYIQLYNDLHHDFISVKFTEVPDRQLVPYLLNFSNVLETQFREQFIDKAENFLQSDETPPNYSPFLLMLSNFYCRWKDSFIDYINNYYYMQQPKSDFNDKHINYYLTLFNSYIVRANIVILYNKLFALQVVNPDLFSSMFDDVIQIFPESLSILNNLNEIPKLLSIMDKISASISSCDVHLRNLFATHLIPEPNKSRPKSGVNLLQF